MSKGNETRASIIARSAPIFNQQGYSGASMSDIMAATGLKKGGIYNHFAGKDELALAAFDYNWKTMRELWEEAIHAAGESATAQLLAAIDMYGNISEEFPTPGGCPVLNTAVESDDGHPQLRARVQQALDEWRAVIRQIVQRGVACGEFDRTVAADEVASVIIATLEGAIMLTKVYQDAVHMQRAIAQLRTYVQSMAPL